MIDQKYTSEAVKARLSIDNSATKVAQGERFAAKEEEYLKAINLYTTYKKTYEYLEVCYRILSDIGFQSWQIYDTANKKGDK